MARQVVRDRAGAEVGACRAGECGKKGGGLAWLTMGTKRIFISYRRSDAAAVAGRLADLLMQQFGGDSVFMDVDAIPPGVDFIQFIRDAVKLSDAMLVVIGPSWLEGRLHNPHDFVRLEIEAGLESGLPVLPVLVEDAQFPLIANLPSSLRPLAERQAIRLRHESFRHDSARLVTAVSNHLHGGHLARSERTTHSAWRWLVDFVRNLLAPSDISLPEADQSSDRTGEGPSERSAPSRDELERLGDIVRRARASGVPLARILGIVEDASCEGLNHSKSVEQIEEHLLAFQSGTTLPIMNARLETIFWNQALESRRSQAFAEYLVRFPHGSHVARATKLRDQLISEAGGFDPGMPRIFLNYRRSDSQDTADRMYAVLSKAVPPQNIVMDVDRESIMPGLPVEPQLRKLVARCNVMFAVIHSRWIDELVRRQAQHDSGQQIDFVRMELKCGLERGDDMPVVPVLAEGVGHPRPTDLPEDIRRLSERSSTRLSRDRFDEDVLGLLNRITSGFERNTSP